MIKYSKYRLRIIHEKLESPFSEANGMDANLYYDGLVNFELTLHDDIINGDTNLVNHSCEKEINEWKGKLDNQGKRIKEIVEAYLHINNKEYNYFIGIDSTSLYLSFLTENDFKNWNRNRIIDDILE